MTFSPSSIGLFRLPTGAFSRFARFAVPLALFVGCSSDPADNTAGAGAIGLAGTSGTVATGGANAISNSKSLSGGSNAAGVTTATGAGTINSSTGFDPVNDTGDGVQPDPKGFPKMADGWYNAIVARNLF